MTAIAISLSLLGFQQISAGRAGVGWSAIVIGGLVYAFAWIIGVLDSLQSRRLGWLLALILLLPLGIGPLLYSIFGLQHRH
jgi:uncharacterized membrane protein